jgi:siroheme synthase
MKEGLPSAHAGGQVIQMSAPTMRGKVYLIGAGSGEPGLLTAEAVTLLRGAEVVLHDDSVSPEILELIPPSAQVRGTSKLGLGPGEAQERINSLLISAAREGRHVVRLKSGDPLLPARIAEETEALVRANVDFELVRGVKPALAAAAAQNSSI